MKREARAFALLFFQYQSRAVSAARSTLLSTPAKEAGMSAGSHLNSSDNWFAAPPLPEARGFSRSPSSHGLLKSTRKSPTRARATSTTIQVSDIRSPPPTAELNEEQGNFEHG